MRILWSGSTPGQGDSTPKVFAPELLEQLQGTPELRAAALREFFHGAHKLMARKFPHLGNDEKGDLLSTVVHHLIERILGPAASALGPIEDLDAYVHVMLERAHRKAHSPTKRTTQSIEGILGSAEDTGSMGERGLVLATIRRDIEELLPLLDPQEREALQLMSSGSLSASELARNLHPDRRLTSTEERERARF